MVALVWSRRALEHLAAIRSYIGDHEPNAAARVVLRVLDHAALLGANPELGRRGRVPGTRELVVPGLPYVVAHTVERDRAVVLAVLHGAQ